MSVIHNIINKRQLDISKLDELVSNIDGAKYIDRGNGTFYFWIDGKSTRGFDLTIEEDCIEIRNTILSNKHDYDLTNKIVEKVMLLTDGIVINEDDEQISDFPIFDDEVIAKTERDDCEVIHVLSKENDLTIYSPIREVHFGNRLHEEFKHLNDEELKNKIFDLILTVNYQMPNFEYGNIIQVENSENEKKIVKLLTNKSNCIINKYDYISLDTSVGEPIMITNKILNSMLPIDWQLIDEFTIVAPITSEKEWNKLLANAKEFDLWDEFTKD